MLVTMDFPTPPLPDTTPMTFLMQLSSWGFSKKLWGACFLSPQLWLQDPQSWVQPSGVEQRLREDLDPRYSALSVVNPA